MCYLNDICCLCLCNNIDLKKLSLKCDDNLTYYEKLTATISEMVCIGFLK